MAAQPFRAFKVVMLGPSGSGAKTTLVNRFVFGTDRKSDGKPFDVTIGAAFLSKQMNVDGVDVKLNIWDTAGQERYLSMSSMYTRGADIVILGYDITDSSAFISLDPFYALVREWGFSDHLVLVLVGNKVDLESSRAIPTKMGEEKAKSYGCDFFLETSAVTNQNVTDVFYNSTRAILQKSSGPRSAPDISEMEEVKRLLDSKKQLPKRNKPLELPTIYTLPADYKELVLSKQMLKSVPAWAFSASLVILDLAENKLTDIPAAIAEAKSLRKLFLQKNYLTQLPQALSLLKELRVLHNYVKLTHNYRF